MNAVLQFPVGFVASEYLEHFPLPCTAAEIAFEHAVDKYVTTEALASWMESADNVREPSKYFIKPISNEELFGLVFGRFSSGEQREQAAILLHMRFVSEHMEEIQRIVAENKEYRS